MEMGSALTGGTLFWPFHWTNGKTRIGRRGWMKLEAFRYLEQKFRQFKQKKKSNSLQVEFRLNPAPSKPREDHFVAMLIRRDQTGPVAVLGLQGGQKFWALEQESGWLLPLFPLNIWLADQAISRPTGVF
jgi:hypothetical protein